MGGQNEDFGNCSIVRIPDADCRQFILIRRLRGASGRDVVVPLDELLEIKRHVAQLRIAAPAQLVGHIP